MFKKICLAVLIFLSVLSIAATGRAESPREITVSAAISLKNAFEEIGKLYEERAKKTKISFNFGASGALRRQVEGGAPIDVFASASQSDMDGLEQKNLIVKDSRVNFAINRVVLVIPWETKMEIKSFEELAGKNIRRIAVGNPRTVPAGRYAQEVFEHYKIVDHIKDRLILGENVRQVLDYVARAEVDAGVVYLTDALVGEKEVKIAATAPEASHRPVVYPIAVLRGAKTEALARDFISLVTSMEGRRILDRYGFRGVR